MTDKKDLLEQLRIDRAEPRAAEPRKAFLTLPVVILLLLVVGAMGFGFSFVLEPKSADAADKSSPGASNTSTQVVGRESATPANSVNSVVASEPAAGVRSIDRSELVLSASGYVVARRLATVSSEITGRITEVLVEEGIAVEQGQVLARLDDAQPAISLRLAKANVESVEAGIQSLEVTLKEARRVLARELDLKDKAFSSEARLTSSQASVDRLIADIARAQADLNVAKLEVERRRENLEDTVIRAPFSGVVVNKAAQAGEIISPVSAGGGFTRTGICTLVDMDSLEIEVDVNEAFIGRVFAEQPVRANLDAYPDWDIQARVIAIVPTANRSKATVRVRIAILVKDPRILPDMGIKVDFLAAQN